MKKLLEEAGVLGLILGLLGLAVVLAVPQIQRVGWVTDETIVTGLKEIGFLLISTGMLSAFFDLLLRKRMLGLVKSELSESLSPDTKRLGIKAFYKNRSELETRYPLRQCLSEAEKDVLVVSIGATFIAAHYQDLLKELAQKGVNLRFLILQSSVSESNSSEINPVLKQLAVDAHKDIDAFRNEVDTPFRHLTKLQEQMARLKSKGHITVLRYNWAPTIGIIVIDGDRPDGKILVELYPYGCEPSNRPSFQLEYMSGRDSLYNSLLQTYNSLWKQALEANSARTIGGDT